MAIPVVEQLEVIDIEHHLRNRLAMLGGELPFARQLPIEAAPVGEATQSVEACKRLEVFVGDLQFLLARGEFPRHIVKRCRERFELGDTRFVGRPARAGRHAEARRSAAEPGKQQNEYAKRSELQTGNRGFAIDAVADGIFVEPDGKTRSDPRDPGIRIQALDPVESGDRCRSVVAGQHLQRQRMTGKLLSPIKLC